MKKCFLKEQLEEDSLARDCSSELIDRENLSSEQLRILRLTSNCKKRIKRVCRIHLKQYLYEYAAHQKNCCDPFGDHTKPRQAKKAKLASRSLITISLQLRDRAKCSDLYLIPGKKLCVSCNVKLSKKLPGLRSQSDGQVAQAEAQASSQSVHSSQQTVLLSEDNTPTVNADSNDKQLASNQVALQEQLSFDTTAVDLEGLNKWLKNLGLTPISQKKISKQKNYGEKVLKKLKTALEKSSSLQFKDNRETLMYAEMIDQLKSYIQLNSANSKKILALSVLPASMSYAQMEETFGVSNYMAKKSRALVKESGILTEPGAKLGRSIPEETVNKVLSFYLRDDVSRPLPGRKDVVSVKENSERVSKRKRLVLSTLGSLFSMYLEANPEHKLSRAKFCELRPKECVLAGQSGTHVICVCTYHENPNLMFEHARLKSENFKGVKDCRLLLLCPNPQRNCFLRQCENCPQTQLQEALQIHLDSEMVDSVTYNQWDSTDRGNISTLTQPTEDFITNFISQIETLIPHDFVHKEQTKFFQNLKETLKDGEVLVSLDFWENFTVVLQRSVQSNYFNGKQITIHPFVTYYWLNGELQHDTLVIISDHLEHSTTAVHVFQKKLISHLKDKLQINVKKVYYQSDGCAPQYKNKKAVANVWFHERDFGMPAEWHYHATSHGKSACDGVTGRMKFLVYQHSLQVTNPEDLITNAPSMAKWLQANVKGVSTLYVPSSEVLAHELELMVRFGTANDVDGIQSHHAIIPRKDSPHIEMKLVSTDTIFVLREISVKEIQPDFDDIEGFVLYSYNDGTICLGNVTDSNILSETFTVQVLEPTQKPLSYEFSDTTRDIFLQDILCNVSPYFQKKGTIVKLRSHDYKSALVKLKDKRKVSFYILL